MKQKLTDQDFIKMKTAVRKALDEGFAALPQAVSQYAIIGNKYTSFLEKCGVDLNAKVEVDDGSGKKKKLIDLIKKMDRDQIKIIANKKTLNSLKKKMDKLVNDSEVGMAITKNEMLFMQLAPELISYIITVFQINKSNRDFLDFCILNFRKK